MTRAAILLLVLACTACESGWPKDGGGGMAEARWKEPAIATIPVGLHDRLTCTLGRLEALHAASDRRGQNGGQVGLLDIAASRAKREYAGYLYRDSAVTLAELDNGIDRVRHDMTPLPPIPGDCT